MCVRKIFQTVPSKYDSLEARGEERLRERQRLVCMSELERKSPARSGHVFTSLVFNIEQGRTFLPCGKNFHS